MKLFASTRTKRNTAFTLMLVWLFVLASGVANACLLEPPEHHSMAATEFTATMGHAPAELLAQLGANGGHHHDADSTKESDDKRLTRLNLMRDIWSRAP